MQISPDTSFSQDGPANVISSRHVPFPTSTVLQPRRTQNTSQPIDYNKELSDITSTQQIIHQQLSSIVSKLDSISPPPPADDTFPHDNTTSNPQLGGWH